MVIGLINHSLQCNSVSLVLDWPKKEKKYYDKITDARTKLNFCESYAFYGFTITSKMRLPTTTTGHYRTAGSQSFFSSAPKLWYGMFRGLVACSDDGPSTSISNYLHRIYGKQIFILKKIIKKLWKWDLLPNSRFIESLHVVPSENRTIIEAIWNTYGFRFEDWDFIFFHKWSHVEEWLCHMSEAYENEIFWQNGWC